VEVMFPIEAPKARERILEEIVPAYLRDNVKARILRADGTHYRVERGSDEPRHRVQEELLHGRIGGPPAAAEQHAQQHAETHAENGMPKGGDEAAHV